MVGMGLSTQQIYVNVRVGSFAAYLIKADARLLVCSTRWPIADVRGRDEDFSSPPAQIPACAANAPGSSLGSDVGPHAV
jgi:hypothetical protein